MNPKFSIIIPVYNVAPYLHECLRSVMDAAQEVKSVGEGVEWRVEIVCVDDGSTDGSGESLDAWAARWGHRALPQGEVRIIHQANAGVSAARNRGLAEATGEWFCFVDADDTVEADWLKEASRVIEERPGADMITFGQDAFDEKGVRRMGPAEDPFLCGFFQTVYRRETLGAIRFPPYRIGEDRVYTFKCLARARENVLCDGIMYHYRLREGSAMKSRQTLTKRWHNFRHSVDLALLMPRIRTMPFRWRVRIVRAVFTNFIGLLRG